MTEIYLITPPVHRAADIFKPLDQLIQKLPVAAVRLRLAAGFDGPSVVTGLKEITQNRDVALLIEDDIDFALRTGADGVHLTTFLRVKEARRAMGEEANIGAECFASRHAAMEAGEAGADYVSFSPANAPEVVECIKWWTEMSAMPCVAEGAADELAARRAIEAGADFLALPMDGLDPETLGWLVNLKR